MSAATLSYGSRERGLGPAMALSALVHVALIVLLFIGVRFQNSPPETVSVELWEAAPPPPPPVVEIKPPPPPPPPKAEPEPEVKKPEIALPEKPKPKPKPEPKPEPKPKPKPEAKPKPKPEPPKPDLALQKQMREQAAQEERQLAQAEQERQLKDLLARQQAAARDKGLATWTDRIRGKVRGNIIFDVTTVPPNIEAIFEVALLPTGEVLHVVKRKSSGNASYDDAVYRAILKSSPLPKPDDPGLFRRQLELKFRPQDR